MDIIISAFYKFSPLAKPEKLQPDLKALMRLVDVRGTVLLSSEGLNGTICGARQNLDQVIDFIKKIPGFSDLETKESAATSHVFDRAKVKVKAEIISLDRPVDMAKVGTYLNPREWHEMIQREDVLILDSRNDYEFHVGHFKGTLCPDIKNFKQFPDWVEKNLSTNKHKKIATFCTGGIRCEKSTAYLKEQGFEEVYHLKGGILKYLEEMPKDQSLWEGDCYVFDERLSVDHDLKPSHRDAVCTNCGAVLTSNDRRKPQHIPGVQCVHCAPLAQGSDHVHGRETCAI